MSVMLGTVILSSVGYQGVGAGQPRLHVWQQGSIRSYQAGDLTVREITTSTSSERPGLTLVWAALKDRLLEVSDVREYGPANDVYARYVPKGAIAAINGGFFGYSRTGKHLPLGLVIANGQRKNPLMRWSTGGILARDATGRVRLIPVRQFRAAPAPIAAIQSKPLLVEGGVVAIRGEDSRFNRSAVAIASDGTVVLAGAFESFGRALTLKEFAAFLVQLREIDKIHVDYALGMDGGPGAHLSFPPLDRQYGDPGQNYVPNLVYLRQ